MLPYLEFSTFEEYVAHLQKCGLRQTNLDIGTVSGKMSEHGIQAVAIYAVATNRITHLVDDPYIAVWARPIYKTDNVAMIAERDGHRQGKRPMKEVVNEQLGKVRAHFEAEGIECEPGRWLTEKPEYMW
ncbi:MAG: hypothetical protein ACE5I2_16080 [Anaerolineae bacterium]